MICVRGHLRIKSNEIKKRIELGRIEIGIGIEIEIEIEPQIGQIGLNRPSVDCITVTRYSLFNAVSVSWTSSCA